MTQNGVDYDDHHFEYSYYAVHRAFPRSGPSDASNVIVVNGEGFNPLKGPLCRLNGTESKPLVTTYKEIRCKVPEA